MKLTPLYALLTTAAAAAVNQTAPTSNETISSADHQIEIVGGSEVPYGQHRHVTYVVGAGGTCTGSLISYNMVLTAAHCCESDMQYVLIGAHDKTQQWQGEKAGIRHKVLHPSYKKPNNLSNDVCLLGLDRAINNIQKVEMNFHQRTVPGEEGWARGYGMKSTSESSNILRQAQLWMSGSNECGITDDSMMCTKLFGQGICYGDSGGPLTAFRSGREVQVGVNSWGITGSCGNVHAGYARLANPGVAQFIQQYWQPVVVYQHANWEGDSVHLGVHENNNIGSDWNDRISSVRVVPGYSMWVWEHPYFQGAAKEYTGEHSFVGQDWNDRISSFKIVRWA